LKFVDLTKAFDRLNLWSGDDTLFGQYIGPYFSIISPDNKQILLMSSVKQTIRNVLHGENAKDSTFFSVSKVLT
jgi:hypothetical protein